MRKHIEGALTRLFATALLCASVGLGYPMAVSAQSMGDYTNYPIFLNQNVPPNVLFLVDMGNYTLEAAYAGSNHWYPLSYKTGTATVDSGNNPYYAANVTLDGATAGGGGADNTDLRAVDLSGNPLTGAGVSSPADTFNSSYPYYGAFDPNRCYTYSSNSFVYGSKKLDASGNPSVSLQCAATMWDGNFLNWLSMRKQEVIYQVLVGGRPLPAQANQDGTANSLGGMDKTGENGSTSSCSKQGSNFTACWRYVKFVDNTTLSGRVPSGLPLPTVNLNVGGPITTGRFFGSGEGTIYVNDDVTVSPFDTASANKYNIKVDLTSEPDSPPGTGVNGTCPDTTIPTFAGQRVCYMRERSLGLFQTMRLDNMHVAVMFVNASTGQGGSLQFGFDQTFNAASVTNIRNNHTQSYAPLAESLYEGLCLYLKSHGPCYDNGNSATWGTGYTNSTGTTGDPFYNVSLNQMVRCCKNYILMISPGIGVGDGGNPTLPPAPFSTASTMNPTWANNIGVRASSSAGDAASADAGDRLDDVAYYGRTHDMRSDLGGSQYVTLYSVNAMGRKVGATLLGSAAKYGGFNDLNNDGTSNFTPTSGQACVYPTSSNLNPGTAGPFYSDPEWDAHGPLPTDPPDCVPDTFFDANDGYNLRDQILAALNDILKNSASGTSISVLASSSNGDGSIYQAYFYPETPKGNGTTEVVSWTGYFQGIFIDTYGNLREDHGGASGAGDGRLVYADDNIVATDVSATTGDVIIRRYLDSDGDGKADDAGYYATPRTGGTIATLREMQGMWEAGKKLALRNLTAKPRNLFTWVDLNNDGVVTANEQMAFSTANATTLSPYLRAAATGTYTATNIISFLQGNQINGMRDRAFPVDNVQTTWRLGDIVNSSPTIVGAPRERFDLLYGDKGYRQFLQRWANRRQTAYVGANDGMLHAFNVGFYHRGDDPGSTALEHGWYTTASSDNSSGPELGEEMWGFVPHYILPQLMWLTQSNYTHISYVDLKPKVTDVRIFTAEAACGTAATPTPTATGCIHPDGWGTILIMGMRFGGSCGICAAQAIPTLGTPSSNGGPPLAVTANFGSGVTTRYFYSGYIVLDITDPDATPKVLSAFSNWGLGLTTSYPTVIRMSPKDDGKNDHTNARWMMLLGSGVHGYDGRAAMYGSLFGVLLVDQGANPAYVQMPVLDQASSPLTYKSSYMSDLITFDRDLDFRSDAVYGGRVISGDPLCAGAGWEACGTGLGYWTGKMYRLTMGTCITAPCSVLNWGVMDSGWLLPTEMVTTVPISGTPVPLGPVTASSSVTLDNSGNTWVFFGTGRFMSALDKTDQHAQYLVGVKDSVMSGCTQSAVSSCHNGNLLDVTSAAVCVSCASGNQVQGVGSISTFTGLTDKIQGNSAAAIPAMDGWVIKLAPNSGSTTLGAERSIVAPTLIGGAVFFPTFTPSSDVCVATGTSQIYGLYYLTGTGSTDPIFGVDASGKAVRSISGGEGVASSVAIQIGGAPTGVSGFFQSSNSAINKLSPKVPAGLWSQFIGWIDQRT